MCVCACLRACVCVCFWEKSVKPSPFAPLISYGKYLHIFGALSMCIGKGWNWYNRRKGSSEGVEKRTFLCWMTCLSWLRRGQIPGLRWCSRKQESWCSLPISELMWVLEAAILFLLKLEEKEPPNANPPVISEQSKRDGTHWWNLLTWQTRVCVHACWSQRQKAFLLKGKSETGCQVSFLERAPSSLKKPLEQLDKHVRSAHRITEVPDVGGFPLTGRWVTRMEESQMQSVEQISLSGGGISKHKPAAARKKKKDSSEA